jgi:hypothetical protein
MTVASPPHPCCMKTLIVSNTAVRTSSLVLIMWYFAHKETNLLRHQMVYKRKVLTLIVHQTINLLKVLGLSLFLLLQYQLFLYLWNHKITDQISCKPFLLLLILLQLILSVIMQIFIPVGNLKCSICAMLTYLVKMSLTKTIQVT